MTDSLSMRTQRWRELYDPVHPRRFVYAISLPAPDVPRPLPWPSLRAERLDWAWEGYQRRCAQLAWLDDDALPFLEVYTGTEIFAEAFGCPVARPDDTMPFALPLLTRASEVARLRVPEVSASSLACLFDMADDLRARAGGDALMRLVDIQSPMDIAALIWDKNDFFAAMLEAPEAVVELAGKVAQLLTAFLDAWFARYGRDFIAHYPTYYMADGLTLSADEVGSVGEETFAEFFLPELVALSARYGGLGLHCCANARHQWPGFLRIPGLRTLNLVQPPDAIVDAYHFFAPHMVQMHCSYPDGDPWTWPAKLPEEARVIFDLYADTPEEAKRLAGKMRDACG